MSFAIPKLEPDWVCLHEAAPRVVEREPSLDIGQVRQTLCDAIAYGRLHVQSDDDPNDALTWTAFRARQRGFIGNTFAETWRKWLENGAEISWDAGMIFVSMAGRVQLIRLPRVRLADALDLFEVPEEKPVPEEGEPEDPTAKALTARTELNRWYKEEWVGKWPEGKTPPSREDDLTAARGRFPGVSEPWVRDARRKFAPGEWTSKGRRKSQKPLADHLREDTS